MVPGEMPSVSALIQENLKEFAALLVLGVILGYAFYYFQSRSPEESPAVEERGVLQMEKIVVNDFVENRKGWQLRGDHAVVLEESRRMRIEQVRISIFVPYLMENQQPEVDLYITADEGLIEWRDNRITLLGNVVLNRKDGSTIYSETAVYDARREFLTLPKPVRILKPGHTLEGSSLTYEVAKKKLELTQPLLIHYE